MHTKNTKQQGSVARWFSVLRKGWFLRLMFGFVSLFNFLLRLIDYFKH